MSTTAPTRVPTAVEPQQSAARPQPLRFMRNTPRGGLVSPQARQAVQAACADLAARPDLLMEHLHRINDAEGGLRPSRLAALAEWLRLSTSEVFEVASFYHHFRLLREDEPAPTATVRVCTNLSCALAGADALLTDLQQRCGDGVAVEGASCMGLCTRAPGVLVGRQALGHATAEAVLAALPQAIPLPAFPAGGEGEITPSQPVGRIGVGNVAPPAPKDAEDLAAYRAGGGYALLADCRAGRITPEVAMQRIEDAELRGLGGAGFPSVRKWRTVAQQPGPRLVVINADEGEVGTCKDGHLLRTTPHRMLEGILIAAWAVAAGRVWIYLRDEYAAEGALLHRELQALHAAGLLRYGGVDIGGAADDEPGSDAEVRKRLPQVALRRGAGAYICGEESALIESLEGKRGMPRLKPPIVAISGLFGRPTLEHNVETLWWVRDILNDPLAWANQGRRGRKGLRRFTVSGRVAKPGVVLAPAGITSRELIDEYCGGMATGWTLYGVLPGGASGGILNESQADLPLDFGTLDAQGCFIGSMAVIVLGRNPHHTDTATHAARNLMQFFAHESCGQCTPCREGTHQMLAAMAPSQWDGAHIGALSQLMRDASICGLGQAAPNPTDSVLRHFPQEVGSGRATAEI
ncbi:NADH dehydrogenase (Quinone) [Thiomonas sp. X19]|uniref:NADH-ubiquinone oxidoreductase-F iron-sulfur binding region domain-containing protein n=1 Tax=Thiomonas sp. X19 TaxID=1050370 RepID=UPI000B73DEBF|nr:NADH-ubiquinone oxidoreductase-F iron-sulfur binding region domain-containing protein [Thiomonas sp. X19]SCC91011.1 NADH dehydrogenase (Quinone) [Thiomonas sp. X19]